MSLWGAIRHNATEPEGGNIVRRFLCVASFLSCGAASSLLGQGPPPPEEDRGAGFRLEQNYPNPFNPETRIPFELSEDIFADGRTTTVSIRIFNILNQFVAAPVALAFPGGEGLPLLQLEYTSPGRYEAFWDGRDRNGRQVASGVYFVQMVVNGRTAWMKMFVTK